MNERIVWLPRVRRKLLEFRSERFTPEETLEFISDLILDIEEILLNPVLGKSYTEEFGEFKGISRVVVGKFKVYYEHAGNDIVIMAVRFPGEP